MFLPGANATDVATSRPIYNLTCWTVCSATWPRHDGAGGRTRSATERAWPRSAAGLDAHGALTAVVSVPVRQPDGQLRTHYAPAVTAAAREIQAAL